MQRTGVGWNAVAATEAIATTTRVCASVTVMSTRARTAVPSGAMVASLASTVARVSGIEGASLVFLDFHVSNLNSIFALQSARQLPLRLRVPVLARKSMSAPRLVPSEPERTQQEGELLQRQL